MHIEELIEQAYEVAKSKGWHDEPLTLPEEIALMHSELSEALEEFRNGIDPRDIYYREGDGKPEGIAVEFADVLIRIFDTCRDRCIPLGRALEEKMAFNKTRPHRHGGKRL